MSFSRPLTEQQTNQTRHRITLQFKHNVDATLSDAYEQFYDLINSEIVDVRTFYNCQPGPKYFEDFCALCSFKNRVLLFFEDCIKTEPIYAIDRSSVSKIADMLRNASYSFELTPYAKMAFAHVEELSYPGQELLASFLELFTDEYNFIENKNKNRTALYAIKVFLPMFITWRDAEDKTLHNEDIECFNYIMESSGIEYCPEMKFSELGQKIIELNEATLLSLISFCVNGHSAINRGATMTISPKKKCKGKHIVIKFFENENIC